MEIKAPKSINDLRIKHLPALTDDRFSDLDLITDDMEMLDIKLNFVSVMCGISYNVARTLDLKDLNKIYIHCCNLFSNVNLKATPPKELVIKGKLYEMVNPNRVATGWHADFGATKKDDYLRLACLMYIPKGSNYSELDETGNLKHFISDRMEDFKEHFPLVTFMQSSSFFLRKLYRYKRNLEIQERVRKRTLRLLNMFGKRHSMKLQNFTE
jgi:hypothetical protein